MRKIDIEQRSEEWKNLRKMNIGASDCAPILRQSKWKSPRMIWKEKLFDEETFVTPAMEKGNVMEETARKDFSRSLGMDFKPAVYVSSDLPFMMASLDGYAENVILEIKVVSDNTFEKAKNGEIYSDYEWQVQHQLFVCPEAKSAVLGFWNDGEMHQIAISRDEKMQKKLRDECSSFYHVNMNGFVEPPPTDLDVIERMDEEWKSKAVEYRSLKRQIESLEERKKELENELIGMSQDHSSEGGGVRATRYYRRGSIQYSKIEELKNLDLEKYRSDGGHTWRFTLYEKK